jgi:membrane associated rhomboid family serine protease
MFPIRDTIPSRSLPVVNWLIIACNVVVFFFEASLPPEQLDRLIHILGMIPRHLVRNPIPEALTILTSMFLHGGWFHVISNMWALYIFGDNVEDRIGHFRYLGFYLLCGVIAAGAQVLAATNSPFPMVGASGAIAGILGAYVISFPRARVLTLIPIFFIPWFIEIPATFYLGVWFLSQLFNGLFALAIVDSIGTYGGVAWWAHIGGFVAGLILVKRFERRRIANRQML